MIFRSFTHFLGILKKKNIFLLVGRVPARRPRPHGFTVCLARQAALAMGWACGPLAGLANFGCGVQRPRRARSPRLRPVQRHGWWRLIDGLGGRRWSARSRGEHGACAMQEEGRWGSPRWHNTIEVAEQRRHGGFPMAMMPSGSRW
jgi:hypothetical protein